MQAPGGPPEPQATPRDLETLRMPRVPRVGLTMKTCIHEGPWTVGMALAIYPKTLRMPRVPWPGDLILTLDPHCIKHENIQQHDVQSAKLLIVNRCEFAHGALFLPPLYKILRNS